MSAAEQVAAWSLQARADEHAADLAGQDPAPAGSDLAWQQEQIRGGYEDAARLADQPKGWKWGRK